MPRARALSLALLVVVAGCGSASAEQGGTSEVASIDVTTDVSDETIAQQQATSAPAATSSAPATAVAPTSTIAVPTTVPLPDPVLLPLDDEAPEPVVPFGSIAIPAIGIDRPLFEGIRLPTFDLGPGHWPGTAQPGQAGNMVIGGHRTEGHADFGDLDLLQPGNEVIVTDTAGASFTYLVESTEIIDPFAAKIVYQTPAKTATLFACHPKGSTDRRIVVHLTLAA